MFKIIKANELNAYRDEIKRLKEKVNELIGMIGNPKYTVEKVLGKDISWYDYRELKPAERNGYAEMAKSLLSNEVFKNEGKYFISDLVKEIAYQSNNFETVRDLRMTINGFEVFKERLEEIGTNREPTKKNLNSSI